MNRIAELLGEVGLLERVAELARLDWDHLISNGASARTE